MKQSGPNGKNRTEQEHGGLNGQIRTKLKHGGPNRAKGDQIGPKWTEYE